MAYIKKLVMHGFKSFANKTEIFFDKGINVIIGPNGSGKSNISDALCFVLGRLSTKSIRAAKAKNLLFMGSKYVKPAREAVVEMVFDNSDSAFGVHADEVSIMRTVRNNGLSVYKINGEVKTRADIIEALAQAGIDPHGFNLVLQGQIQAAVGMHPEERRKVVEEVAGISIYEARKEKSLHELEKTDEKLKEINAILRERTAFLRNLENERQQALKFKELELTVKRCKASILSRRAAEKEDELASIQTSLEEKTAQKDTLRGKVESFQKEIEGLNERIRQINKHIQSATGVEREALQNTITNLKAELEGLRVRKENFEHRKSEVERRIAEITRAIPLHETEIKELKRESPLAAKKQAEIAQKKQELARIEEERRHAYSLKTELNAFRDRIRDKETQRARITGESDALIKQLEEYTYNLIYTDAEACKKALIHLTQTVQQKRARISELATMELEATKLVSIGETEISAARKIQGQVAQIDICPLCQSKMTQEHITHVAEETNATIERATKIRETESQRIKDIQKEHTLVLAEIRETERNLSDHERELSRHHITLDKKEYLKRLVEQEKALGVELKQLNEKRDTLQQKTLDVGHIEESYVAKMHEIEEISSRTDENIDQTLIFKERELEKLREKIKFDTGEIEQIASEIHNFAASITSKSKLLDVKVKEEEALAVRFKKLFEERDALQESIQHQSFEANEVQSQVRQIEDQMNYLKIGNAKLDAEREAIQMELSEYAGLELIKASMAMLEERLQKTQATLHTIGSINLRALDIYDQMKQEYDRVQEKVNTLVKEKEDILKIIEEIDNKKKRTFMRTFNQINELFSTNFSKLSTKGQAFLQIENEEDLFAGGVSIVIRMGKGKYFDVASLSGGEKTLVALSLLFAIQEYKPYHFYIFDEIDAALDKRNSERLSALLRQYMRSGQYITITHNDALIMDANILYGVSMHEGVSKILSLKMGEEVAEKVAEVFKPSDNQDNSGDVSA
ncbi:MAG: chromosome segregation SMC family protein [Nanoarchaeota archaeon]